MTAQAATKSAALQRDAAPASGSRNAQRAPKNAPHTGATGRAANISRTLIAGVEHWLNWQCRMIVGVHHGAVYVPQEGQGGLQAVAYWPQRNAGSAVMLGFAEQAFSIRRSVLHKAADDRDHAAEVRDFIAFPLSVNGQVLGVIALALEIRSEAQRQAVVQLLEWGSVWLENTLQGVHTDRREDAQLALEVVAILAADLPLPVSAHQACNRLAETFHCSRVALGVVHGMQVRVEALSNQVQFDRRLDRILRLCAAMEECIDQEQQVCLPGKFGVRRGLTRAHARLLELDGTAVVCSQPVLHDGQAVGAFTLIWDDDAVDSVTASRMAEIARQIAPVLALKQREGHSVWRRGRIRLRAGLARLFGHGFLKTKLIVGLGALLLVAGSLIQTDRRIAAPSVIEGTTQQAIVAPLNGYLIAASARAGDRVGEGQVLALIDDRELLLEKQKWQSERDKHAKEYQEALGSRDRAKISIASSRIAQAEAELRLVDDKLARTRLLAPFTGTLVSGDLSRSLGAPLERGQLLFEIVPDDSYRISLQVDEHDIAGLEVGQPGELRLTGMPGTPIDFTIERVVPLANADQSGNRFRVEATPEVLPGSLRPGMQGVAKVVTGRTSLLQAWTGELVDRLRFWFWSIGL